jgi:hypothetical protein
MMRLLGPLLAGFLFALGLGLSRMTHPERIIGFLDFTGAWNPSLGFVMVGAVAVYALLYPRIASRPAPLFAAGFSIPTRKDLEPRLIAGSALFGVGWGLGGFCPGPSLVALFSLNPMVFVFVASMLAGMVAFELRSGATSPTRELPARAVPAGGRTDG